MREARISDKQQHGGRAAVAGAQSLDPVVVLEGQQILCRDAKPCCQIDGPGAIAFSQRADLRKVVMADCMPKFDLCLHSYHPTVPNRPAA